MPKGNPDPKCDAIQEKHFPVPEECQNCGGRGLELLKAPGALFANRLLCFGCDTLFVAMKDDDTGNMGWLPVSVPYGEDPPIRCGTFGPESGCIDCSEPNDAINPSHYQKGGMEHVEIVKATRTREQFLGYLWGQATKYLYRWPNKIPGPQDLEKSKWFLDRLIKEVKEESDEEG